MTSEHGSGVLGHLQDRLHQWIERVFLDLPRDHVTHRLHQRLVAQDLRDDELNGTYGLLFVEHVIQVLPKQRDEEVLVPIDSLLVAVFYVSIGATWYRQVDAEDEHDHRQLDHQRAGDEAIESGSCSRHALMEVGADPSRHQCAYLWDFLELLHDNVMQVDHIDEIALDEEHLVGEIELMKFR